MMIKARDPVCGMAVDTANPPARTTYRGRTYYFCAPACLKSFEKNPAQYISAQTQPNGEGEMDPNASSS